MRFNGVASPLGYKKGCGRPARGNGGLRRPRVYTPTVHTCQKKTSKKANKKKL